VGLGLTSGGRPQRKPVKQRMSGGSGAASSG